MQLRTTAADNPKMESECNLKGKFLLLLLLLCRVNGQSQQSQFFPNLLSTIQAKLGSFNRFAYIPKPVGPFITTGYRPGEVNFAYPNPFMQQVPQQPVIQFISPPRNHQNVPLPTSPTMRDEVRHQAPPNVPSIPNADVQLQNHPAALPTLTMVNPSTDNRPFHDVRFVQPPAIAPSDNARKELPVEKFHKPVIADPAFGRNNIRKIAAPAVVTSTTTDKTLIINKNPQYSTEIPVINDQHHNVTSKPTRIPPHANKEQRPFSNFKPIAHRRKAFPSLKPVLPRVTETNRQPTGVPNMVNFQDENLPGNSPTDISLVQSDSISHSVYVKPPEKPVKVDVVTDAAPKESPLSSAPPVTKNAAENTTPKPERVTYASSVPGPSEDVNENELKTTTVELPLPQEEKHLISEEVTLTTKSVMPSNEVDQFDGTTFLNWTLGDKKALTGTPEEILTLKLADAINNFGFGLYHKLQENENIFFSPLSLSAALAIVLEGSSNMTAVQIMNGLHFSESNIRQDEVKFGFKRLMKSLKSKRSDYQFENANLLLLQNNFFFKGEFSNTVYKHYKPLLGLVDFATNGLNIKRSVNDWVKRRTHGKIDKFLKEQLPPETVFAVLNAVYFRGQWKQPFESTLTHQALFYNHGKDPVQITMMKQIGTFPVGYSANLDAQIIELPYEGEETSMVILLPEKRDGIYQLRNKLNYQELYVILSAIDFQLVQLSLPRFSLRSRYDMEDVLKEVGLKDVFVPGKANFGRMTNVTGLYLSKVSHEGVIDVDEKGTEAAAGTGGFVIPLNRPRNVMVDHPFFFCIRNQMTGVILFIGQFDAFNDYSFHF